MYLFLSERILVYKNNEMNKKKDFDLFHDGDVGEFDSNQVLFI